MNIRRNTAWRSWLLAAAIPAALPRLATATPLPQRLADLTQGIGSTFEFEYDPQLFVAGDHLYFVGYGTGTQDLWSTDGTAANTEIVAQTDDLANLDYIAVGNTYIRSWQVAGATQALASRGTPATTHFQPNLTTTRWIAGNAHFGLYTDPFGHTSGLWSVDESLQTKTNLLLLNDPVGFVGTLPTGIVVNDKMLVGIYENGAYHLTATDGTVAGTRNLSSLSANFLVDTGDKQGTRADYAYFLDENQRIGRTDGTQANTHVYPALNTTGTIASELSPTHDGRLFYRTGGQLWVADAAMSQSMALTPAASDVSELHAADHRLYFIRAVSGGAQLWTSDGSVAGTHYVAPYALSIGYSRTAAVTAGDLLAYAVTVQSPSDYRVTTSIYLTDGSESGTVKVHEFGGYIASNLQTHLQYFDGRVYYIASSGSGGEDRELWSFAVPEPATLPILAAAGFALGRRRTSIAASPDQSLLNARYLSVIESLHRFGVRYLVSGGAAMRHHGIDRELRDLDLWLDTAPDNLARFTQAMRRCGMRLPEHHVGRLKLTPTSGACLDFVIDIHPDFAGCYERRETMNFDGVSLDVMCRPDLIAQKRIAGRPRDLQDLESLLASTI